MSRTRKELSGIRETLLTTTGEGECVAVGEVVKTWGLRGEIKVVPHNPESRVFTARREIVLLLANGNVERSSIQMVKRGRGSFFLSLRGCESVEHAERFVGSTVYVRRSDLPPLSKEEYYWFEIIGLKVFGEQGEFFGTIHEIMQTGSNDVYVVRREGKEFLIPAIEEVILSIDLNEKKVVIRPMTGLFDDDRV